MENKSAQTTHLKMKLPTTYLLRNYIVFANGPGDLGSIPSRVIPKTQTMVLDATLLNTQHYKDSCKSSEV